MDPVTLPVPYMGFNQVYPLAIIRTPNAETLLNFNPTEGGLFLRHGDDEILLGGAGQPYLAIDLVEVENELVSVLYDQTADTIVFKECPSETLLYTSPILAGADALCNPGTFKKYTYFWGSDSVRSSAGVWGGIGYTGLGSTGIGSVAYKSRNYIINRDSTKYNYSEVNAISGFTHEVDLEGQSSSNSNIAIVARITIADNVSAVDLIAFVLFSGEVLFYSGNYPDSTTWGIVGRGTIGVPMSYMSGVAFGSDYIAFCQNGPTSLKDLFLKGDKQVQDPSFGAEISKIWKDVSNIAGYRLPSVWDKQNERIIITLPFVPSIDVNDNPPYLSFPWFLIYNTRLQCWYLHRSSYIDRNSVAGIAIIREANNYAVYFIQNGPFATTYSYSVSKKEGADDYVDRALDGTTYPIYGRIRSAPSALSESRVVKCEGMEMILQTGFVDQTTSPVNVTLIGNLGETETNTQNLTSTQTTIHSEYFNAGIESTFVQYELNVVSYADTEYGLDLYSTSLWVSKGTSPR